MKATLRRNGEFFLLEAIGKAQNNEDKSLFCYTFKDWLTARCTLDNIGEAEGIESIKDYTGESKRLGYAQCSTDAK